MFIIEDAERLWERLRLSNAEHERLASMADGWWHISPRLEDKQARALLYRLGPERYRDRVLLAWVHAGADARRSPAGASSQSCPTAGRRRGFRYARPISCERGVEKGPALGAALAAARSGLDRGRFSARRCGSGEIADAAARPTQWLTELDRTSRFGLECAGWIASAGRPISPARAQRASLRSGAARPDAFRRETFVLERQARARKGARDSASVSESRLHDRGRELARTDGWPHRVHDAPPADG